MSLPPLRPHQVRAIEGARHAYRDGSRAPLIVSPTGSGKSRIGVELSHSAQRRGGACLWVAHRHELLDQAAKTLLDAGATLGADGIQLHSVQSLVTMPVPPRATFVVYDEAHHYTGTPDWSACARYYSDAVRVGLTATPWRQDGAPMGDVFDALIVAATVRELTEQGLLVPCEVLAPAGKRNALAEDPVTAYRRWGDERRAIVFCSTVAHAKEVAAAFDELGIPAACVDGKTRDRAEMLEAFREGRIRVLTNVQILTEGTDLPEAEVAILARSMSHAGALMQCAGRVLRLAPWIGKRSARLIDLKGSVWQHGLPSDDRVFSLHGKAIELAGNELALKQCKACGAVFRWQPKCPRCGRQQATPVDPKVKREAMKKVLATHTQEDRATKYRELVELGRQRGYAPKWPALQFKIRYGYWPHFPGVTI